VWLDPHISSRPRSDRPFHQPDIQQLKEAAALVLNLMWVEKSKCNNMLVSK